MPGIAATPPLSPPVTLPEDAELAGFSDLFDGEWVWRAYCRSFGQPEDPPHRLRLRQLSYNPRRRAIVSCAAEWLHGTISSHRGRLPSRLSRDGQPARPFRYPQDPYLPGLSDAAAPEAACSLLNAHVFEIPVRRVRVNVVRYRPGGHAVLRHRVGDVRFYVRVMRPDRVARLIDAAELVAQSGFALPRLAGCWTEGGVVWLSEIPGTNVRRLIRKGDALDPEPILDALTRALGNAPDAGQQPGARSASAAPTGERGACFARCCGTTKVHAEPSGKRSPHWTRSLNPGGRLAPPTTTSTTTR